MVGLVLKIQFRSRRKAHVYNISLKILSCSACGNNKRWMRKLDSFPGGRLKVTACTNLTGIELLNSIHFSLYSFITYPLNNYLWKKPSGLLNIHFFISPRNKIWWPPTFPCTHWGKGWMKRYLFIGWFMCITFSKSLHVDVIMEITYNDRHLKKCLKEIVKQSFKIFGA